MALTDLSKVSHALQPRSALENETAGAEKIQARNSPSRIHIAILVCPFGPQGGVLETALDLSGFIIVPAYSFADAQRCLVSRPEAELVVCPCHIGKSPWTGLKSALPSWCQVILTLPFAGRICAAADPAVLAKVRQPCQPADLRILVFLLREARKRTAEKRKQAVRLRAIRGAPGG